MLLYRTGNAILDQPADEEADGQIDAGRLSVAQDDLEGCWWRRLNMMAPVLWCCSTDSCIVVAVRLRVCRKRSGIAGITDSCIGGRSYLD